MDNQETQKNNLRFGLVFLDVFCLTSAFVAAYAMRQLLSLPPIQPVGFYVPFLVVVVLGFFILSLFFGLYARERSLMSLLSISDFLKSCFLWATCVMIFSYITKAQYSRLVAVCFLLLAICFTYLIRFFIARRDILRNRKYINGDMDPRMSEEIKYLKNIAYVPEAEKIIKNQLNAVYYNYAMSHAIKRIRDILLASLGLLVLCPFFPILFFWIKHDTHGNVFIAQRRVKQHGNLFTLYKFRTMFQDADLYALSPRNAHDPRITPAGKFLRTYSIDELPQLWNVLRGDMSIVGPRPEMPFIVKQYTSMEALRLTVKPGITGVWQIFGRKDLPLEENIEYDLYYILHQSFFLDLAILLKTIPHLILPHGAY